MPESLTQMLQSAVARESANLRRITEAQALERPPKPGAWSRKEELGHLIDSAANNHLRFVRGSFEQEFRGPGYSQDDWVRAHGYHELPWPALLDFWESYNRLLVEVVRRIPAERLETKCFIGSGQMVTLGFVIEDYVLHMQHHIDHILRREKITAYPGAALGT